MNEASQAIVEVKREVQLAEWKRQIQERQEQGVTVDKWCLNKGISKGAYYHRLRKVREYMCQQIGIMEDNGARKPSQSAAVVPLCVAQSKGIAAIEMQLGDLQIRFNETPNAEQLKLVLNVLAGANKPVC